MKTSNPESSPPCRLAALAAAALLAGHAGATIVAPTYVAASSTPNAFDVGTPDKLVDNSGMTPAVVSGTSLDAAIAATHIFNGGYQQSWVTIDPAPAGGDYFAQTTVVPILVFDLGQNLEIRDLFFWQYQNNGGGGNAIGNQVRTLEVRFNTAAEGNTTFSGTPFNVTGLLSSLGTAQLNIGQRRTLDIPTTARYVQLRITDNYFGQPGITGGGDRVGIGEFRVNVSADPEIVVPGSISASGNGSARQIPVQISNAGSNLSLNITNIAVTGTDAGLFTVGTATPFTLAPGTNGTINLNFTPGGITGAVAASLVVTSSDPFASPTTIPITGTVREPWVSTPASATVGSLTTNAAVPFTVTVSNLGGVTDLILYDAYPTGADQSAITLTTDLTTPITIPAGGSTNVAFSFDPAGEYRPFTASLAFETDDPVELTRTIPFTAELLRNPKINVPATVASGPHPNASAAISIEVPVKNEGASNNLTLTGAQIDVSSVPGFAVTSVPGPIAPGATGTIQLSYTPVGTSFGISKGTLLFDSNDPGMPFLAVDLAVEVLSPAKPGGLVAWWPLNNPADPGQDASGNGLHGQLGGTGTLTGAAGAGSGTGGALDFDGAVRLTIPQNSALNPPSYTVVFWASPDAITGGHQSPITSRYDQYAASDNTYGYIAYRLPTGRWDFWSGTPPLGTANWDTDPNNLAATAAVAGAWQHVAIRYDATTTTKTIFVNGVAASTWVASQPSQRNLVRDLHIGAGQDLGDGFFFNGKLDDVAVFNTALSETDINAVRTTGVSGFTGITQPSSDPFAITGVSVIGGNIVIGGISGLVTGAEYHLETGVNLNDFAPVAGSTFLGGAAIPTVPVSGPRRFVRIVSGPVPPP